MSCNSYIIWHFPHSVCSAVLRKAKEVRQQLADIMEQQKVCKLLHVLVPLVPDLAHASHGVLLTVTGSYL